MSNIVQHISITYILKTQLTHHKSVFFWYIGDASGSQKNEVMYRKHMIIE